MRDLNLPRLKGLAAIFLADKVAKEWETKIVLISNATRIRVFQEEAIEGVATEECEEWTIYRFASGVSTSLDHMDAGGHFQPPGTRKFTGYVVSDIQRLFLVWEDMRGPVLKDDWILILGTVPFL